MSGHEGRTRGLGAMVDVQAGQANDYDKAQETPSTPRIRDAEPASLEDQIARGRRELARLEQFQRDWNTKERHARLDHLFSYHAPTDEQREQYELLRHYGRLLAQTVLEYMPAGADQSEAIRLIRTAVMTANAGIALGGKS